MSDEPLEIELTILPDPSAPAPPPSRRRLHVGSRWRIAAALAVVLVVGAGGFVLLRDEGPNADAVLRDARAAVAEVRGFELRLTATEGRTTGGEHINTEVTERFLATGKWSDGRWSTRSTTNSVVAELLVDGDTTYSRSVDLAGGAIGRNQWTTAATEPGGSENLVEALAEAGGDQWSADAGGNPVIVDPLSDDDAQLRAAIDVYLGVRAGGPGTRLDALSRWGYDRSPRDLLEVVDRMRPTEVTEGEDGRVVLTGRLQAAERHEIAFGAALPSARVVLHLDAERVPTRLQFALRAGGSSFRVDAEFRDWSEPVAIDVPHPDDIDQTPTVDEAHLVAAATSIDLVWPTAIPQGWTMSELAVAPPTPQDIAGARLVTRLCDTIVMAWIEPIPQGAEVQETAGMLRLMLTPLRCAQALDQRPFTINSEWGVPMRLTASGFFELQIGETAVVVEAWAMREADLDAAMRSFSRVDVDTVLAAAIAAAS